MRQRQGIHTIQQFDRAEVVRVANSFEKNLRVVRGTVVKMIREQKNVRSPFAAGDSQASSRIIRQPAYCVGARREHAACDHKVIRSFHNNLAVSLSFGPAASPKRLMMINRKLANCCLILSPKYASSLLLTVTVDNRTGSQFIPAEFAR